MIIIRASSMAERSEKREPARADESITTKNNNNRWVELQSAGIAIDGWIDFEFKLRFALAKTACIS